MSLESQKPGAEKVTVPFPARHRDIGRESAFHLLALLVLADLGFMGLHAALSFTPYLRSSIFAIDKEWSYAEFFQYLKWGWLTAMFVWLAVTRRSLNALAWSAAMAFLLVDDARQVHETVGEWAAGRFGMSSSVGEVLSTGSSAAGLTALIAWTARRGSAADRSFSRSFLAYCVFLGVCGVGVDFVHPASKNAVLAYVFDVLEDGGEMVAASAMVSRVFRELLAGDRPSADVQ